MRKNSLLVALTCAMAVMLIAGRCSDDDDKAAADGMSGAKEAAPVDSPKELNKEPVDSGVETDPLGSAIGAGADDMTAPPDEAGEDAIGDDIGLDESFPPGTEETTDN